MLISIVCDVITMIATLYMAWWVYRDHHQD